MSANCSICIFWCITSIVCDESSLRCPVKQVLSTSQPGIRVIRQHVVRRWRVVTPGEELFYFLILNFCSQTTTSLPLLSVLAQKTKQNKTALRITTVKIVLWIVAAITLVINLRGLLLRWLWGWSSGVLKIQGTSFPTQPALWKPEERKAWGTWQNRAQSPEKGIERREIGKTFCSMWLR